MDPEVEVEEASPNPEPELTVDQRMEAFASGLAGNRPTATPVEPEAEPEPPAPKYRQITEDEWTALQSRAAEVESLKATLEKTSGTAFGKIGGIERRLAELGATGVQALRLPKDKLDRLRNDLPEVVEAIEGIQATAFDQEALMAKLREQINPDAIAQQGEERAWKRLALARASEIHEDWQQVAHSEEFKAHAKAQGDAYLAALDKASQDYDYRVITSAITKFKADQKAAADKANARRQRIESNLSPRGAAPAGDPPRTREDAFNQGLRQVRG